MRRQSRPTRIRVKFTSAENLFRDLRPFDSFQKISRDQLENFSRLNFCVAFESFFVFVFLARSFLCLEREANNRNAVRINDNRESLRKHKTNSQWHFGALRLVQLKETPPRRVNCTIDRGGKEKAKNVILLPFSPRRTSLDFNPIPRWLRQEKFIFLPLAQNTSAP